MLVHALLAIAIYSVYFVCPYGWMYVLLAFSVYSCDLVWIPLALALGPFSGIAVWGYFFTPLFEFINEWKWSVYSILIMYGMFCRFRYLKEIE